MLNLKSAKTLTGLQYVYLIVFFTLLAGFFHPLITGASFDTVIVGVLVLFVGLFGGILLYKSATSDSSRGILLACGFGLMGLSLYLIFLIAIR